MVEPAKTTWVAVPSAARADDVGEHAVVQLDGQPAGDLLALLGGGDQHGGRADFARTSSASTAAFGATR